jgi:hypothetical protein
MDAANLLNAWNPYWLEMDEADFPFLVFTILETISETANHKSRGREMVYS